MNYDVVIVGAGVAGNTVALECVKAGLKTLVVEKSDPKSEGGYRIKPCGGGLSEGCVREFPQVKEFIIHKIKDMVHVMGDQEIVSKDMVISMSNRDELDLGLAELAQAEGAEYVFGKIWNEKTRNDYDYKWLIGAGGATCPISRNLNYKKKTIPLKVAYFDDPDWNDRDQAEIYAFEDMVGYGWVFPKGSFVDVGLGAEASGKQVNEWYRKYLNIHGYEKPSWEGAWMIPMTWYPDQRPIIDDTILIGDSGNFVNPATGEGIYYSMLSAREAARVITGDLEADQYPTFGSKLYRIQKMKDEISEMGTREFFEIGLKNKKLFDDTVGFLFCDKPEPKLSKRTDGEKSDIYNKLLKKMESLENR